MLELLEVLEVLDCVVEVIVAVVDELDCVEDVEGTASELVVVVTVPVIEWPPLAAAGITCQTPPKLWRCWPFTSPFLWSPA